jgi:hypothetical protein
MISTYIRDAFDTVHREGTNGRLLSIGLHDRLIGRPGRCAGLVKLLDYMFNFLLLAPKQKTTDTCCIPNRSTLRIKKPDRESQSITAIARQ